MSGLNARKSSASGVIGRTLVLALTYCGLAGLNIAGCAAAQPYNPDNLGTEQFSRVADICLNVLGLSPHEPLTSGNWQANSRLDFDTSHYRGCVVSLSDSLQSVADTELTQQADQNCRARGLKSDSPELALCVLNAVNSNAVPAQTETARATAVSTLVTPPPHSFFTASPRETVRRERIACAALGLSPSQGEFKSCVKQLDDTFYAIDNPIE